MVICQVAMGFSLLCLYSAVAYSSINNRNDCDPQSYHSSLGLVKPHVFLRSQFSSHIPKEVLPDPSLTALTQALEAGPSLTQLLS